MSVYAIFTYDVVDPEGYAKYMPGSAPVILGTIASNGGEVIFADNEAIYEEGTKRIINVCIKFPSIEHFHAWENDPEYAEAKGYRLSSTDNYTIFVAKEFALPG